MFSHGASVGRVGEVKVSVIAALYNTGPALKDLIGSLDAQTMSADEFEVVLVDDGSTDDTLAIARSLAAERPNLVVETIPNSGWPGRPRNVGIEVARGRYVFFADHDDHFGPLALESVYAAAVANHADIVYGKVVRLGRTTPYWSVWHADLPVADPTGPVITSRTIHKLFRRSFLLAHDLRFLEGRVRLEDHEFMARAIPRANVISVLASVPTYWWVHRNDGSNHSNAPVKVGTYWGHYSGALRAWAAAAGPGPLLDAARVTSLTQAFGRGSIAGFLDLPPARQKATFAALRELVSEHFPAELDPQLALFRRASVGALRADDMDLFRQVRTAKAQPRIETPPAAVTYAPDGRCLVRQSARYLLHGEPVRFDGSRVTGALASLLPPSVSREVGRSELGAIELTVRHRDLGIEWPVRGEVTVTPGAAEVAVSAELDMQKNTFGSPYDPGIWDVIVRAQFLGEATIRRVLVPALPSPPAGAKRPYRTESGALAFKLTGMRPAPVASAVEWDGAALRVRFASAVAAVAVSGLGGVCRRAAVPVTGGNAVVPVPSVPAEVWARFDGEPFQRVAYAGRPVQRRRVAARAEQGLLLVARTDGQLGTLVDRLRKRFTRR